MTFAGNHAVTKTKMFLEFLGSELDNWQYHMEQDETPTLLDLSDLIKTSRIIYSALGKQALLEPLKTEQLPAFNAN